MEWQKLGILGAVLLLSVALLSVFHPHPSHIGWITTGQDAGSVISLPASAQTKLQSGINITTDDLAAQIFANYTAHFYHLKYILFSGTAQMNNNSVVSAMKITNYIMYPVLSSSQSNRTTQNAWNETTYTTVETCDTNPDTNDTFCHNDTVQNGTVFHPATTALWNDYTIGNATTAINATQYKEWILEVDTGNFQTGHFNISIGAFADPNVTCGGSLSSANTIYTMNSSCSINGSTAMTISAANVTLDCAGFSITGNNSTSTYGI